MQMNGFYASVWSIFVEMRERRQLDIFKSISQSTNLLMIFKIFSNVCQDKAVVFVKGYIISAVFMTNIIMQFLWMWKSSVTELHWIGLIICDSWNITVVSSTLSLLCPWFFSQQLTWEWLHIWNGWICSSLQFQIWIICNGWKWLYACPGLAEIVK